MNQAQSTALSGIKGLCSKLNWKHGLIIAASAGLILYPQPIIKLFLPVVSKFSPNHAYVECHTQIKEIILTTNQDIELQNISRIKVKKGSKPKTFKDNECKVIDWLQKKRKRSNIYSSNNSEILTSAQDNNVLFGETLWNSYRLARLENKTLKSVLIKCSEPILQIFLLRFYNFSQEELHKLGGIPPNKLIILRLNQKVGTYEHLTCDFEDDDLI